jgi:hypothetical protein
MEPQKSHPNMPSVQPRGIAGIAGALARPDGIANHQGQSLPQQ